MLDRQQAMAHEPLQRGGDLVVSSIPYTWREQAARQVSQAEGVISQIMRAITTEDWSLQHCHDYLVELEMVTSGALMALRLTANDIISDQVSQQAECIGSRAREARNMALDLRQKHLDAKLQVKDRPMQAFQGMQGGTPGPGPGRRGGYDGPQFSGRLDDLREFRRCWGEYERLYYPKEQEDVLMELLHSQALGPELRKVVSRAPSLGTTRTNLEDHLREQREKIDHLLSDTLRAGEPVGPEELYRYYKKVCQFLDTKEGEGTVSCHVTMDQLDMLLCTLPAEETFEWGRRGERRPLEDLPDLFYDFCWEHAEELRAQIRSTEGMAEEPRVTALPSGYPLWLGPCVLGEICGGHHMPEVCQMFEAMTTEGRLSVIQKKELCQFCFRHPDTQPCPSHSLPACPIRGCMRMHHMMLHRALMREEARPVVLGMAQSSGSCDPGEDLLTSDSEDSTLVTSDEEEGRPEKSRLCMQMVPVEANSIVQGLHTLYDWGSMVTLVRRESMRRLGFWLAQVALRLVNGFGGATVPVTGCHFLPLIDVKGKHQVICTFEVEEITAVAETRLPPWAKEVFPSVRAHMPWMDTPAGPKELLIGLDNSQWLPVRLEDSKEPSVNMRLTSTW
jgi:hypothetical protein